MPSGGYEKGAGAHQPRGNMTDRIADIGDREPPTLGATSGPIGSISFSPTA